MKKHTKQQLVEDSFYREEDDEDLQELRAKKELEARQIRDLLEAMKGVIRQQMYMIAGICFAHDKAGCPQCTRYARGECPSAIEEGLPHDF